MKIKILKIEPGKKPEIKEIEDGLKSLQDEVQGDIEAVYPFDDNVGIICNEEGKINGMALNRALYDDDGEMYDIIAGPFLVVGLTEDSFSSLSDEMLSKYTLLSSLDLKGEINWDWFILLVAKTGMRFSEALALTPKDFDFAHQTLSISKTWDYKGTGGFLPTKNKCGVYA